jgi:hypothetical protein
MIELFVLLLLFRGFLALQHDEPAGFHVLL